MMTNYKKQIPCFLMHQCVIEVYCNFLPFMSGFNDFVPLQILCLPCYYDFFFLNLGHVS